MNPLRSLIRRTDRWLGGRDLIMLLAVLLALIGFWAFVGLALAVKGGETQTTDDWVLRSLRQPGNPGHLIGPPWMEDVSRDLTSLGDVAVLTLLTASVAGYLLIRRSYRALALVLVATLGGVLLSTVLKWVFARPRPPVDFQLSRHYTASFPSGHSMVSAVVYLTLGSLLARLVKQRRLKIYFIFLALLLTFLIGITRVCLGVHYPSDVLAGWTAGLTWAILCWLVARHLQKRRGLEG
jgi:undecaprenyl-diphosphatase